MLAAKRSGIREIILPKENEPNVREEIPEHLRQGLTFHFVKSMDALIDRALEPPPLQPGRPAGGDRPAAPPPLH